MSALEQLRKRYTIYLDQGFPTFSSSRTTFILFLVAGTTMHVDIIKLTVIIKQKFRLTIPSHKIKIVRGPYLGFCGPLVVRGPLVGNH